MLRFQMSIVFFIFWKFWFWLEGIEWFCGWVPNPRILKPPARPTSNRWAIWRMHWMPVDDPVFKRGSSPAWLFKFYYDITSYAGMTVFENHPGFDPVPHSTKFQNSKNFGLVIRVHTYFQSASSSIDHSNWGSQFCRLANHQSILFWAWI